MFAFWGEKGRMAIRPYKSVANKKGHAAACPYIFKSLCVSVALGFCDSL